MRAFFCGRGGGCLYAHGHLGDRGAGSSGAHKHGEVTKPAVRLTIGRHHNLVLGMFPCRTSPLLSFFSLTPLESSKVVAAAVLQPGCALCVPEWEGFSCQMLVLTCGTREMAFQAAWSSGSHVPTMGSLFHSYSLFPWSLDQQRGHKCRHGSLGTDIWLGCCLL